MRLSPRTLAAVALALLLGGSALAAVPPKTYPTGRFAIAGTLVTPRQVLDARAIPDLSGKPAIMVTLDPAAAAAIARAAGASVAVTLDDKPLGESPAAALADSHVVQVSGDFGGYEGATALARRISGKDPLPDTEGDE